MRFRLAPACALVAALVAGTCGAKDAPSPSEARLDASLQGAAASPADEASVRRWEYVVLVRVAPEVPDAIGRAEVAALKAGAAVLEGLRDEATLSHADHRLLIRTRDESTVHEVVKAIRTTRGVLGATAMPLPETPTYPGGPSFFESYMAPRDDRPSNADRVVMRHDVPPLADTRELLEMSDVLTPPSAGPDGTGGFTMNISELFSRMKEGMWRRREERLRNTPIEILPPAPAGAAGR